MDLSGSGTSTVRSTTSSEIRLRVGEEGMVEVEMESPKAAIGEATRVDPGSIHIMKSHFHDIHGHPGLTISGG